jgi:hypothetical protein
MDDDDDDDERPNGTCATCGGVALMRLTPATDAEVESDDWYWWRCVNGCHAEGAPIENPRPAWVK